MWRGRSTTKAFPPSKRRPKVTSKSLKPIRSGSRAYAAGSGLGKHSNRCLHAPVIHDVRHYYSESVLAGLWLFVDGKGRVRSSLQLPTRGDQCVPYRKG